MAIGKLIGALVVLAAGVTGVAVYTPETAERYWPESGVKAAALRAYLPLAVLAKLPPSSLAKPGTAASLPAGEGGKPPVPTTPEQRPAVSVTVALAKKGPLTVRLDTIGTIQPIASVALRTRADAQIDRVLVNDGAAVKAGDVLVKLDSRQVEAQIKQAEATLAKDRAQLEQGNRDVARYAALIANQTGLQINLDNAKTTVASLKASIIGDEAAIENLKVQLTWYTINAPISGRVGTFTAKAGNIIRSGDSTATGTLAVINQITPIYVAFSLPQIMLPELRAAMAGEGAKASATPQGLASGVDGKVAVIDNAIDASTGTITARATFDNADEVLWPGQLCNVRVTLRTEPEAISVPREAIQNGQAGSFVYVIADGVAKSQPVTVARVQDGDSVIADGLKGGETIVIEGALQLTNNARVEIRNKDAKKGV